MRTRDEIIKDNSFVEYDWKRYELLLEVLLDIRDSLPQTESPQGETSDYFKHDQGFSVGRDSLLPQEKLDEKYLDLILGKGMVYESGYGELLSIWLQNTSLDYTYKVVITRQR